MAEPEMLNHRQSLNPLDLALCCVDRAIRGMGYPGFETQMLVWLAGRVDPARLQRAIGHLARRHPIITSSLRERIQEDNGEAYWEPQACGEATLQEVELTSSDLAQVLSCAQELLSTAQDPALSPPIRFHLLHRPDGRDVFLMQYNHVLMDNSASVLVTRAIDRFSDHGAADEQAPAGEPRRLMDRYLQRFPRSQRRAAVENTIELNGRVLRGRAAILGKGAEPASLIFQGPSRPETTTLDQEQQQGPRQVKLRLLARTLDPERTRDLQVRTASLCGFPSLSMAILASTFRAMHRLGPEERNAERTYVAGIGLDLNLRTGGAALFQNLLSIVPISAKPQELTDRDELVKMLSRQIRNRLETKIDLGIVRLAAGFRYRVRHMRWTLEHLVRYGYSLWYAYFGALDGVGPQFCGINVENACYVGPTWSPLGIGLLVNQFGGQLCFQLTYDPYLVDDTLANEFLDTTLADLLNPT